MEGSKKEVKNPLSGTASGCNARPMIEIVDRGEFHHIRVIGGIDIHTGVDFQSMMQDRIRDLHLNREGRVEGPIEILLDLTEGFADGSGMRSLMEAVRFAEACQFVVRFLDCRAARYMTRFTNLSAAALVPTDELPS